jgi:hypothetical protein
MVIHQNQPPPPQNYGHQLPHPQYNNFSINQSNNMDVQPAYEMKNFDQNFNNNSQLRLFINFS